MRPSEVGARLGGVYGAEHAAREPDPVFARVALACALAATAEADRERVLLVFLRAYVGSAAHARVEAECAHASVASVCALLVDEARLY
jgi:hypothetical protein